MPLRVPPYPHLLAGLLALAALVPCPSVRANSPAVILTADSAVAAPPDTSPKPTTRAMLAGGGVLLLLRWVWRGRGRDSGIGL